MQRQPPQQLTGWGWMQKLTPQETMTNSWLGRSTRELTTLRRSAQVAPARGDAGLTLDLPPSLTAHAMRTAVRPRYVHHLDESIISPIWDHTRAVVYRLLQHFYVHPITDLNELNACRHAARIALELFDTLSATLQHTFVNSALPETINHALIPLDKRMLLAVRQFIYPQRSDASGLLRTFIYSSPPADSNGTTGNATIFQQDIEIVPPVAAFEALAKALEAMEAEADGSADPVLQRWRLAAARIAAAGAAAGDNEDERYNATKDAAQEVAAEGIYSGPCEGGGLEFDDNGIPYPALGGWDDVNPDDMAGGGGAGYGPYEAAPVALPEDLPSVSAMLRAYVAAWREAEPLVEEPVTDPGPPPVPANALGSAARQALGVVLEKLVGGAAAGGAASSSAQ